MKKLIFYVSEIKGDMKDSVITILKNILYEKTGKNIEVNDDTIFEVEIGQINGIIL